MALAWQAKGAALTGSGRELVAAWVVDALAAAARQEPPLVVLEDLQWSDSATLRVVRAVADVVAALPVMLAPAVAAGPDLGPVLDASARRAFRHRLVELEGELDEAESDADIGRLQRLRTERAMLSDELAGALGLGGRPRLAGDPVERARKAVTMRIRAAITVIPRARRRPRAASAQHRTDGTAVQLSAGRTSQLAQLTMSGRS